ncbi:MAG: DMT family transporter [Pseudomonadota bacterium]
MYAAKSQNNALAAVLVSVATAFIAGTTLLAKALGSEAFGAPVHPVQIVWGRFVFAFIGFALAYAVFRPAMQRPHLGLHVLRTSGGFAGLVLMFAAVNYVPLADATAISFLNPVFGMFFAIVLLGERVGKWRWLAAAIALSGMLILLRPTPGSFQPAALLALGAAVILGFELNIIKLLTRRENPFSILIVNNAIGVGMATLAVLWIWQMPTGPQWAMMAALGLMMGVAQACFINAMARADASFVAPFSYGTLIFAAFYDALFYGVIPDWVTVTGAVIIVAGALLLAWREGRARAV